MLGRVSYLLWVTLKTHLFFLPQLHILPWLKPVLTSYSLHPTYWTIESTAFVSVLAWRHTVLATIYFLFFPLTSPEPAWQVCRPHYHSRQPALFCEKGLSTTCFPLSEEARSPRQTKISTLHPPSKMFPNPWRICYRLHSFQCMINFMRTRASQLVKV